MHGKAMVLGIESSCDETAAAVVRDGVVLSSVVASQVRLHAAYGGVVPELATREHLRNLIPVAREALARAGVVAGDMNVVVATRGPGLPAALASGYAAAQGMAMGLGVPLMGVHHHEAHLYSPWIEGEPGRAAWDKLVPNVSLIVSGGHTMLVKVEAFGRHRVLGSTLDDAAGECFDKVAKLLGLGYPGGPEVDRLAEEGRGGQMLFPRPMLHEPGDDFSFSGLKTSVRTYLGRHPEVLDDISRARSLCAEVREAVVETLVGKTLRAARREGVRCVTASGGVSCNRALRRDLAAASNRAGMEFRVARPEYCTDNAAMAALLGERLWREGHVADGPEMEVLPGWGLDEVRAGLAGQLSSKSLKTAGWRTG